MSGTGLLLPPTETARWRTLYENVHEAAYGTVFSFDWLTRMAGLDPEDDDIRDDRWIIHRCRVEMLRHDKRYLASERGVGYRVIAAAEHLGAGHMYRRKTMRAAARTKKVLAAADLAQIEDPEVRSKILDLEVRMGWHEQQLRHVTERLSTTEHVTERLTVEVADYSDRLAAVEERLKRMAATTDI